MPTATMPGFRHLLLLFLPFALAVGVQAQNSPFASPIEALTANTQFRAPDGSMTDGVRCGTPELSAARIAEIEAQIEEMRAAKPDMFRSGGTVTVPVAFHVLRSGNAVSQGNIPDSWLQAQIDVLNDAFDGTTGGFNTTFRFEIASIDRTTNSSWYTGCFPFNGSTAGQMTAALAIDPATTFNFYTCRPSSGILGQATFPTSYPENSVRHGVIVLDQSLPGGNAFPYNQGDTGTHEVGHYLGLFHTFQGGCFGSGDSVADTPPESSPAFGCPIGRDTCSGGGPDPIRNFMDYVDDSCMFEFTGGQSTRMDQQVAAFKPTLFQGGGNGEGSISSIPTSSQSLPASGGTMSADFTLSNSSGSDFEGEWWVQVIFPNGNNGPRLGPFDISLTDGQSVTESISKGVPPRAPAGVYIVTSNIGSSFPDEIDDSSTFTFFKASSLASDEASRAAEDDNTWTLENVTRGEASEFVMTPSAARATATLGAYPTPFSDRTTVSYTLDEAADVQIAVYDVLGRRVALLADGTVEAGEHEATFDAADLPSGTYLVRLEMGEQVQTQQITLMK